MSVFVFMILVNFQGTKVVKCPEDMFPHSQSSSSLVNFFDSVVCFPRKKYFALSNCDAFICLCWTCLFSEMLKNKTTFTLERYMSFKSEGLVRIDVLFFDHSCLFLFVTRSHGKAEARKRTQLHTFEINIKTRVNRITSSKETYYYQLEDQKKGTARNVRSRTILEQRFSTIFDFQQCSNNSDLQCIF